jgi:hypothetical protein
MLQVHQRQPRVFFPQITNSKLVKELLGRIQEVQRGLWQRMFKSPRGGLGYG